METEVVSRHTSMTRAFGVQKLVGARSREIGINSDPAQTGSDEPPSGGVRLDALRGFCGFRRFSESR